MEDRSGNRYRLVRKWRMLGNLTRGLKIRFARDQFLYSQVRKSRGKDPAKDKRII